MRLGAVSPNYQSMAFKSATFTTSTKNAGDKVEKHVINPHNEYYLPSMLRREEYRQYDEVRESTNANDLGGGEGSRLRALSHLQSPDTTKIWLALPLDNGRDIHLPDFSMTQLAPFADENGFKRINADIARGSFAEIISQARDLREAGKPQQNQFVCCGDNMFHTEKPFELARFMKDVIKDPTKQMGLVGVEREPEEVVKKFGVLNVIPTDKDDIMKLDGFVEKPKTVEIAREFETPNGKCIANTGMFVIKAEAMEWLLDQLEEDPMFLAKDEKELYDFAAACQKVQEHYGKDKCDVKLIQVWEDAGDPKAYYNTLKEIQQGYYLNNFAPEDREIIQRSAKKDFDGKTLILSQAALKEYGNAANITAKINDLNLPEGMTIKNIDGVNVVV